MRTPVAPPAAEEAAPAAPPPAPPRTPRAPSAHADLANVSLSSVEVSRNAKGDATFTVKVYDPDPEAARAEAVRVFDSLNRQYYPQEQKP